MFRQNAVGYGRLHPRYRHLAKWTKHMRRLWFGCITSSSILRKHDVIYMKPENISHCRQRRTEPRPQVTCVENLVKFSAAVPARRLPTSLWCHLRSAGRRLLNVPHQRRSMFTRRAFSVTAIWYGIRSRTTWETRQSAST